MDFMLHESMCFWNYIYCEGVNVYILFCEKDSESTDRILFCYPCTFKEYIYIHYINIYIYMHIYIHNI